MNSKMISILFVVAVGAQALSHPISNQPATDEFATSLNLYGWIENMANGLQETINDAFSGFMNSLNTIASEADVVLNDAETALNSYQDANPNSGACINQHITRIVEIIKSGRSDVVQCIQTAVSEIEALRDVLQLNVETIRAASAKIANVVNTCKESGNGNVTKCIVENLKEISNSVLDIVSESLQLLVTSISQSVRIVDDTKSCTTSVLDRIESDKSDSREQLRECLANALIE